MDIDPVLKDYISLLQIKHHFDLALRAGLQGMGWIGAMDQTRPYIVVQFK